MKSKHNLWRSFARRASGTAGLRGLPLALAICLLSSMHLPAQAQEDDDEERPAPRPRAQAPAAESNAPAPKVDLRLEEPVIRSVLGAKPSTPKELVRAIDILIDLHRQELAKPLLQQLLDAKPNAETLVKLAHDFGSATFIKLAGDPALAPQGGQLADAVLSAAQAARTNPALLDKLVAQLSSADRIEREDAILGLGKAQGAAVAPLIRALTVADRNREHQAVRDMLMRLGDDAVGPLIAMLDARDPAVQAQAAMVLARLKVKAALPALLIPALSSDSRADLKAAAGQALAEIVGRVPTPSEARELLMHKARAALDQARLLEADPRPSIQRWNWDEKSGQSVLGELPPADAAAMEAARFARDANSLEPNVSTQRLFVLTQLTAAKLLGGLDHPLPAGEGTVRARMAALGPTVIEEALVEALAQGQTTAAIAAAEILGDVGREEMLHRQRGALSPLAEAAKSNDRRLRFAAVDAMLKLKPTKPFAGDGTIAPSLAFFAGTTGFRRALVGHPRTERGQQLVALLGSLGYEAETVNNSRQFMLAASQSPDYELGLVHVSLAGPGADDLLARLRRDPRTADLPIGLIAPTENWDQAERVAQSLELVRAMPPVRTDAALKFQTDRLLQQAGRNLVSLAERQSQAAAALDWLVRLSDEKQQMFDLQAVEPAVQRALYVPALSRQAALVLSNLPSATAQTALSDLAGRNVLPVATRQAAAAAFGRSVRLHGVLLTSTQILQQYDRYNTSHVLDRETQQILASLLDSIEAQKAPSEPGPQP